MKNLVIRKTLQNKLWIAVLASLIGLSACNNEREDTTNANTGSTTADSSEMAPVPPTQGNEASVNTSMGNAGSDGDQAYYSDADNPNLDQTSVEGVQ